MCGFSTKFCENRLITFRVIMLTNKSNQIKLKFDLFHIPYDNNRKKITRCCTILPDDTGMHVNRLYRAMFNAPSRTPMQCSYGIWRKKPHW